MANTLVSTYSFTVLGEPVRAPIGALYTDEVNDTAATSNLLLINTIPQNDETGVPTDDLIRLHIVSIPNTAIDATVQVWITRSSDSIRRLAYSQAAGGFQAGFAGADSTATYQASPGSGVLDELLLVIDQEAAFTSLESVIVEVLATAGATTLNQAYTFTIEDLTAPLLSEILWLSPRRARLKFDEAVSSSTEVGGSLFVEWSKGNIEILDVVSYNQIRVIGMALDATWVGYYLNLSRSAYPTNNKARPITAIDAVSGVITVNVSGAYGPLIPDDGMDRNSSGILVRERVLQVSISPYRLEARLSDEGISEPTNSAERIQCAYCPMVTAASLPTTDELIAGEDPNQYVYLDFDDDISYGRFYTIYAEGIEDPYENASTSTANLDFLSPTFNVPATRLGFWSDGVIPSTDRNDDLANNSCLRKLVVVLQDCLNLLHYRTDQLQYIDDPALCADEWVDHMLYNRGNPFCFPLPTLAQKRKLAAALPGFYKQVGTVPGIRNILYAFLGIWFEIQPYISSGGWVLGDAILGRLGFTTTLGPGTAFARNSYEIVSPIDLTTEQRRIVVDIATWADPIWMHLVRIIEPSSGISPVATTYWILGESTLGITTVLST